MEFVANTNVKMSLVLICVLFFYLMWKLISIEILNLSKDEFMCKINVWQTLGCWEPVNLDIRIVCSTEKTSEILSSGTYRKEETQLLKSRLVKENYSRLLHKEYFTC